SLHDALPICALVEHAELDFVELHVRADATELVLQEPGVLPPQLARRRYQDAERQRLTVPVPDAVAVRVAPAEPRERSPGLRRVVRQVPRLGVPDRPAADERPGRDLRAVAPHA